MTVQMALPVLIRPALSEEAGRRTAGTAGNGSSQLISSRCGGSRADSRPARNLTAANTVGVTTGSSLSLHIVLIGSSPNSLGPH